MSPLRVDIKLVLFAGRDANNTKNGYIKRPRCVATSGNTVSTKRTGKMDCQSQVRPHSDKPLQPSSPTLPIILAPIIFPRKIKMMDSSRGTIPAPIVRLVRENSTANTPAQASDSSQEKSSQDVKETNIPPNTKQELAGTSLFNTPEKSVLIMHVLGQWDSVRHKMIPDMWFFLHEPYLNKSKELNDLLKALRIRALNLTHDLVWQTRVANVQTPTDAQSTTVPRPPNVQPFSFAITPHHASPQPVLHVRIPHPESFPELLYFLYSDDVKRFKQSVSQQNIDGVKANIAYFDIQSAYEVLSNEN